MSSTLVCQNNDSVSVVVPAKNEAQTIASSFARTKLLRLNVGVLLENDEVKRARGNLSRARKPHPSAGAAFALIEFWLTVGHISSALA